MSRRWVVALGLSIGFVLLSVVVVAAGIGPQILFTSNILSASTSNTVTAMEQALLDQLNAAAVSIDAAIYDLDRTSVRNALIAAKGRGVAVRVVTDDETYNGDPYYADLEAAGINVVNDSRSSIMHNKFFVVDDQVVWTGSTNMTDTGFTYNHNSSVVMTSTLLADIYTIEFEEMYGGTFGTAKTDNTTHTLDYNGIPVEVYFSPSDNAMSEVISEVNTASDSINFSIFFFTDDALRDAILAKAQQGLTISGIWDLLGAANAYSEDETLCSAGVPIKIEDFGGKMHNKFMIIDANGPNPRVITGSMNWTGAGGDANDENTLIIHDATTAQQYLAAYQDLWNALGDNTLCIVGPDQEFLVFLPFLRKPVPTPTPSATPTNTPQPEATATPTSTPTPTATPTVGPQLSGNVDIIDIFYDGLEPSTEGDEYVEIRNNDSVAIQLQGWTLRDAASTPHVYTFPNFVMQPGQTCRIYTDEYHPEWCGFNYGSGSAIWNNSGDCAYLRNSNGAAVDTYCY